MTRDPLNQTPLWPAFFLLLGLALRIWGAGFGLPHLYHADEPVIVNHALAYGTGDLNPHFFNIPPLVSYLLFAVYGVFYAACHLSGALKSTADFELLFYTDPTPFYLLGRMALGVLPGTLTIAFLYRMVRRHFGAVEALLSAAFLSVCFLHVSDSHYIYADIPLVLVMVLAVDLFFRMADRKKTPRHALYCGLVTGLAAAVKYNGVFLAVPYVFLAACFVPRRDWIVTFLQYAAGAAAAFAAFNPWVILDAGFFFRELSEQGRSQGGMGWTHPYAYAMAGGLGWPLLLAATARVFYVFAEPQRSVSWNPRIKRRALAFFVLFYYAVLALKGQPYSRYALPLMPFLCFFSADALRVVSERFRPARRALVLAALAAVFAFPSLRMCLRWNALMTAPDTRTQAREWVKQNIAPGSSVALDTKFYMPPLEFSRERLEDKKVRVSARADFSGAQARRLEFLLKREAKAPAGYDLSFLSRKPDEPSPFLFQEPLIPYDWQELRRRGIRYLILARTHPESAPEDFLNPLPRETELLASFSPYRIPVIMKPYDSRPLTGGPFLEREVLARVRNGQPIEVYRLREKP